MKIWLYGPNHYQFLSFLSSLVHPQNKEERTDRAQNIFFISCFIHPNHCFHSNWQRSFSDSDASKQGIYIGHDYIVSAQRYIVSSLWAVVENWKWRGVAFCIICCSTSSVNTDFEKALPTPWNFFQIFEINDLVSHFPNLPSINKLLSSMPQYALVD